MLCFVSKALRRVTECLVRSSHSVLWMNRSTNSYAWKLAKLAKSILFLANTSDAQTSGIFETLRAWSVGQTKCNMIMKIRINLVLKFNILIPLFVSIEFNTCRLQFEIEIRSPSQTFLERPVHNLVGLVIPRFFEGHQLPKAAKWFKLPLLD